MGYGQYSVRTAPYNGQCGRKSTTRKKTVYDTSEIAHLWSHKQTEYARNGGRNNFYFDGDTIYSYGSHFPIARHIAHKGRVCVFFTTRAYSVTTSDHIGLVRHSIPPSLKVFYVSNPHCTVQEQLKEYAADIAHHRDELAKSKNTAQRVKLYRGLVRAVETLNGFAEFFGFKRRWKTGLNAARTRLMNAACVIHDQAAEKRREWAECVANTRRANQRAEGARRDAEWQRQNAERLEREAHEAKEWAEKQVEKIVAWRSGQDSIPYRFLQALPVMCRIVGDMVETSKGAEFPVAQALRVLPIVERLLTTGQTYQRNGHSIHLGHYTLDSIDSDGTAHAGCHHVLRAEVERLIALLKALP